MATTRTRSRKPATTVTHNPAKPARKATATKTSSRQAARRPAPSSAPAPIKAAAKTTKPAKVLKPAKAQKAQKTDRTDRPKLRLVRDSFTMPQTDHDLIGILKTRALAFAHPAKKSELLRGGLHALAALDDAGFRRCIEALVPLKPGRPKKAG
jgi:hypothetical protein